MEDKLLKELLSLTAQEKLTVLAMFCPPKDVFPIDESEGQEAIRILRMYQVEQETNEKRERAERAIAYIRRCMEGELK